MTTFRGATARTQAVRARARQPTAGGKARPRGYQNCSSRWPAGWATTAVTQEVDPASVPDLVRAGGLPGRHLWGRGGQVILGIGEALRVPLPAGWAAPAHTSSVGDALSAIRTEGDLAVPGSGPVAIGALPYDPASAGHLAIPRLVIALHHGAAWATRVRTSRSLSSTRSSTLSLEQELAQLRDEPLGGDLPDRFELGASLPHADWKKLVSRAVDEMESGALAKVVLARQVEVVANRPFVVHETLARLASLYPSCAVFHVDGFLGASPETLLRRTGGEIESHPLAGTVARSGDPASDEALVAALMSSSKDRHEHQLVVDKIVATLRPLCTTLDVPDAPSVVPLRNVSHLGTHIRGTLRSSPALDARFQGAISQGAPSHERLHHDGEGSNGRRDLTVTSDQARTRPEPAATPSEPGSRDQPRDRCPSPADPRSGRPTRWRRAALATG